MTRLNVTLSDDLDRELNEAADETQTTKSELLRKALQLYLAVLEGKNKGLKLSLVDPASNEVKTEIVGL